MEETDYNRQAKAVCHKLTQAKKNMYQETKAYNESISSGNYFFQMSNVLKIEMTLEDEDAMFIQSNLNLQAFREMAKQLFTSPRKLSIFVPAEAKGLSQEEINQIKRIEPNAFFIENLEEFQLQCSLFPPATPFKEFNLSKVQGENWK
jgi:hypothetical protein